MILLLFVVILCVTIYSLISVEHFADVVVSKPISTDKLPLNIIKFTGRDISFPYYGENSMFTASQRALADTSVSTNPTGKCYQKTPPSGILDPSYAIVMENNIYYILKKTCMSLNIKKISIANNGSIIIEFVRESGIDIENLTKFLLVNPLFVEFTSENFVSVAYILHTPRITANTSIITINNNSHNVPLELQFDLAIPSKRTCDSAFDYLSRSTNQLPVTQNDIKNGNIGSNLSVNMLVYYLDNMNISFQKIGLDFPTPIQLNKTSLVLFDKRYETLSKNPNKIKLYEFMKTIGIKYKLNEIPILTYSFDVLINKPKTDQNMKGGVALTSTKYGIGSYYQLLRIYMDNNYQGGRDPCNNNMMIATLTLFDNVFSILVGVGSGDDCGFVNSESPPASITLPYVNDNTTLNVTVTIGPKQKYIYVQWYDLNSGKKCAFTSTTKYLTNLPLNACVEYDDSLLREANNMTRMFASTNSNFKKPSLENINLVANTDFISKINEIYFGYPNFNNLYASI